MLKLKIGVQLTVTDAINKILDGVCPVFDEFGVDTVITSGTDGKHGEHSKHYTMEALDFRTRHLKVENHAALVHRCKHALGKDFDVVLEGDHLHVEFDPKFNNLKK